MIDVITQLREALDGIDREDYEPGGWWETSFGAKAGAEALARVEAIVQRLQKPCMAGRQGSKFIRGQAALQIETCDDVDAELVYEAAHKAITEAEKLTKEDA